jgi:hypothetical protein
MSDPDHRRLDDLRQRLAGSENPQTIHEIGRAAARLAERAVIESIVRDCAVLVARCKAKTRQCRAREREASSVRAEGHASRWTLPADRDDRHALD